MILGYYRYFLIKYMMKLRGKREARKKRSEKIPVVSVALLSPRNSIVVGADARSRENIFPAAPSLAPFLVFTFSQMQQFFF